MTTVGKKSDTGQFKHLDNYRKYFLPHYQVAEWFDSATRTLQPYLNALPTVDVALGDQTTQVSQFCVAAQVLRAPSEEQRVGLVLTVWLEGGSDLLQTAASTIPNHDAARVALAHLISAAASSAFDKNDRLETQFKEPAAADESRPKFNAYFQHIKTGTVGMAGKRNAQKELRKQRSALQNIPIFKDVQIIDCPGLDGDGVPAYTEVIFGSLPNAQELGIGVAGRSAEEDATYALDMVVVELKALLGPFGHNYIGKHTLQSAPGSGVVRRRIGVQVASTFVDEDELLYDDDGVRFQTLEKFKAAVMSDLWAIAESL